MSDSQQPKFLLSVDTNHDENGASPGLANSPRVYSSL